MAAARDGRPELPVTASLQLAPMRRRDLRQVMAIERVAFPEPWSLQIFHSELALRRGRVYRVARLGRSVVGYMGLMLGEEEAHITTIAVAPEHQHRGVATTLMLEVFRQALESGARAVSLEVAVSNERAQALYRRFGFAPVGVRKRYYPVTGEDAYVMVAEGIDTDRFAERLAAIEAALRSRS